MRGRSLTVGLALTGIALLGFTVMSVWSTWDKNEPCYAGSFVRRYVNYCGQDAPVQPWVAAATLVVLVIIALLLWLLRRRRHR